MNLNLNIDKIPKRITPCPIAEAIVELRFDSSLTTEVILAVAFNEIKEKFSKIVRLPIMELPAFVRDTDQNLKFSPHYQLANDDYIIQIGPKCFSITCPKDYKGWDGYSKQIKWAFDKLNKIKIVTKPIRLGVRYINFFESCNIFEKIKLELALADNSLVNYQNVLRSEFDFDDFHCVIQLTNMAILADRNTKGSSIDLDIMSEKNINGIEKFETIINSAHDLEKKLFFSILKDDFLVEFNPEY